MDTVDAGWSAAGITGFVLSLVGYPALLVAGAAGPLALLAPPAAIWIAALVLSAAGIGETNTEAIPQKRGVHLSSWGFSLSAIALVFVLVLLVLAI